MVERYNPFIDVVYVPIEIGGVLSLSELNESQLKYAHHLFHLIVALLIRPPRSFGRDPPERATVNLPLLSIESRWARATKEARDCTRASVSLWQERRGALGEW